jgi:hypothetical protein
MNTYSLVLLAVMLGILAALFKEGLWGNTIALFNVTIAGLLATSYFEPVAAFLSGMVASLHMYFDLLSFGGIFGGAYALLRFIAARLSQYRVRFHPVLDNTGSMVLALAIGWVTMCLVAFALHTAPLSRVFLFKSFDPEQPAFFGTAPDRLWLGFAQSQSMGPLSAGKVYDENGEYLLKYGSRRAWFEKTDMMFPD